MTMYELITYLRNILYDRGNIELGSSCMIPKACDDFGQGFSDAVAYNKLARIHTNYKEGQ